MNHHMVSVILATFNGSKYIEKQLDSILNQDILPDEIIICDDNSLDGTVSLLKKYLANDKIKLFVNEVQLGIVENFKKAAKLAKRGNWLLFADQDDIWPPQKIGFLVEEMRSLNDNVTPALIYSDLYIINRNDEIIAESFWEKQKIKPDKVNFERLLYGNIVTGCTIIINYPMAEEFFLMDNNKFLHDEWLALIAYSIGKVRFVNEKLVFYRQHENNVTFNEDQKKLSFVDNIKFDLYNLLNNNHFLVWQFDLAKVFLSTYGSRLSNKNLKEIKQFIELENKSYFIKRIKRRLTYSK